MVDRALLLTDLVDSTALTERLGDAAMARLPRSRRATYRGMLTAIVLLIAPRDATAACTVFRAYPPATLTTGEHISDQAGYSVAGAGDVNGDGYADVLVGASNNEDGGTVPGAAYFVLGRLRGGL